MMQVTFGVFFAKNDCIAGVEDELFDNEADLQTQFVLVLALVAEWVYTQVPLGDRLDAPKLLKLPGVEVGTLGLHHVEHAESRSECTAVFPTSARSKPTKS